MIITDPSAIKNFHKTSRIKKTNKREGIKPTLNGRNIQNLSVHITGTASNPFLYLQEVGEYAIDRERLKKSGDNILKSLNQIRLALLEDELQESHIQNLQRTLEGNKIELEHSSLQGLVDDLLLRCEIELAKIEAGRKLM